MTAQPPAMLNTQGFGNRPENVEVPQVAQVAPTANQYNFPIGKRWINTATNQEYILTSIATSAGVTTATWTLLESGSSSFLSLTGDTGTALPVAGNVKLAGTTNQITTAASGSTVTFTTPTTFIAPGSIASTTTITAATGLTVTAGGAAITGTTGINTSGAAVTTIGTGGTGATNIGNATGNTAVTGTVTSSAGITATTGDITATAGSLVATAGSLKLNGAASRVLINAGTASTAPCGLVTLSGASTTTLTSSAITANSIILFSLKTLGTLSASAITYTTTGGSATITPAGSTDTSVYGYLIIN